MAHRIEREGKFYRVREGREVEIPIQWVGVVTYPQTIKKRPSKGNQGRKYKRKAQR